MTEMAHATDLHNFFAWSLLALSLTAGTVVLVIVLVASLFVERPWCRYACPLGAATGPVSKLSSF